jgi:hypothetical protein
VSYLLLNLKRVNNRGQLAKNFVGSLVVFQLCSDKIGEVPQGLGGIKDLI